MKKNPFIQGAMIATIGIVISKILGIIYVIPFYAVIGQQGGALYGYAYTIYSIFLNLSSVGIPLAISRLTSEYNTLEQYQLKERTFRIGKNVITILSLTSFVALMLFASDIARIFIGDVTGGNTQEDVAFVIRVIATAVLVVPSLSVTKGYLQGHKFITASSVSQIVEQLTRVIVIIVGSYIAVKVLGFPIKVGVGIATFGATVGGLIAYLYLRYKMHKNKKQIHHEEHLPSEAEKVPNKQIVSKIIRYAAPFIFSSLIFSFYDFVDLSTVIKTLVDGLGFTVKEAETVMSIISTWGNKLGTIVTAISTGLVTSLIPNITSSFVKNDMDDVHSKINRSLQIVFLTTLPLTIGLSLLAMPIWTIFYGHSILSSDVLKFYIFVSLFSSVITVLNVVMQSLNKPVRMFLFLLSGLLFKAIFNVPMIYLAGKLGLYPGYGSIATTILGFSLSITLMLISLHRQIGVNYDETVKRLIKIIITNLIMVVVILLIQYVLPVTTSSRFYALIIACIYAFVGGAVYLFISYKNKLLTDILGTSMINKILRKLKLREI